MSDGLRRLDWRDRLALGLHVWACYLLVQSSLRRRQLPEVVRTLKPRGSGNRPALDPARAGRIIARSLRIGSWQPRCLVLALVLYRLLLEQGQPAELVIGLPIDANRHEAHAWVEVDGIDVGPQPGRPGHRALARYA